MKKFWNILIILLPILIVYESPVKGVSIIEILMVLCIPYLLRKEIIDNRGCFKLNYFKIFSIIYICFILLNFIINIPFASEQERITVIFRTGRYLLYWVLLVLIDHVKDMEYSIKIYEYTAVFSIIFLILQIVVLKIGGYYINGTIPFLAVMNSAGLDEQIQNIYTMGGRPFSIFSEPSGGAQYVTGLLAIEFFYKKKINRKLCIFLTLGIFLMASNTGILLTALLYFMVLGDGILSGKIDLKKILIPAFAILILAIFMILNNSTLADRIFNVNVWMGRFGGFQVFFEKFTLREMLFGHGMNDNYGIFMPGIPQFYYYYGYVGLTFIILLLMWLYSNLNNNARRLFIYILVLNLGSNMFFGQFIVTIWFFLNGRTHLKKGILLSEKNMSRNT